MPWWLWMLFGFALLTVEMITPGGFYALFFGIGALLVGSLVGIGTGGPDWLQWLLFSILSVVSLLVFRGPLLTKLESRERPSGDVDTLIGETAILLEDLSPGEVGKAELRGTTWNVHNEDNQQLQQGQHCRVYRVEGLTLWVRAA
jgi:hypothetical protein